MSKPIILYVITQGGPWGGAQKYVADLAEALAEEFLVIVAVGEPNGIPDLQNRLKTNPEIDVIQLKHLRRDISPLHDILAIFELRRLFKKLKPDIVHLNSTKTGILGSLCCYKLKAISYKLIYTVHGWVFHEPMGGVKRALYRALERSATKRKAKIVALSPQDEESGKLLGVPAHKLTMIPPGIEERAHMMSRHDARAKLRELSEADIPMDAVWIGTIANCYPTKGLDVLLRAIAEEKPTLRGVQAILIGDGPERKKLEALRDRFGLSGIVHFTGFLHDASRYLPAFDLFVLPSRKEGLPYTLLEAKAHGIPILATDVGGVSSLIENKRSGTLVPKDNVLVLAEALRAIVENPAEARRMAELGMRDGAAMRFSKTRMIEDTKILYQNLLSS